MKNLKFYSILGLSALIMLSACEKEEPEDPNSGTEDVNPTITLSQTTLTVDAEGGTTSVAYRVDNALDGVSIVVNKDDDSTWITVDEITDSNINFTVEANSESDSRTATFTVSYPGADDVSLTVVQEVQYDYEYMLEYFTGYVYEGEGNNYEDLYYIFVSDIGFGDDGYAQEGGHYYNFYLFVDGADGSYLPTGTYTYSTGTYDMTFFYYSSYVYQYSGGYDQSYLIDGYLNVSADGDTYTIEGVVTDSNGAVHRVYYTGPAEVWNFTLKEDVEFEANTAVASYFSHSGDVMNVDIMFTNMEYDGTYVSPPGVYMVLDTYMTYDEDGKITPGTYNVDYSEKACSIYPEYYSYVYNYETESDYTYGSIMSGSMTIVAGSQDDYYDISCEFVTDGGATVKCTYSGYLVVDDMPGPASTLTGDVTVNSDGNLNDAYISITNYGDYYSNGGTNLYIAIAPGDEGAGDAFYIDLNAASGSTVPSGTYNASTTSYPAIGEYLYGYQFYSYYMFGSWYMELDENWYVVNSAPLVEGSITFTNGDDGSYTIAVDCKDDLDHSIKGSWTGTYASTASVSSVSSRKLAVTKPSKQEMSAKAAEVRAAKNKAAQSDNMKVPVSAKASRTDAVPASFKSNK